MTERATVQVDPTGRIIVELRSEATKLVQLLGADHEARVGGERPDGLGPPFVLVRRLGPNIRLGRAPMTVVRLAISSYGRTRQEAAALSGAVSDYLTAKGARRSPAGVAIYLSTEEVGGQGNLDPDTSEPFELAIYNVSTAHTK